MHCVSHRHKVATAEELKQRITDEGNVTWLIERLIRLLGGVPTGALTANAIDAYQNVARSYKRDGLDGALTHVDWLISSLHKIPSNEINGEVLQTAESLATALQLEW